jgi:hypothetical protein
MEPEGSSQCSQQPANSLYPGPDKSSQYHPIGSRDSSVGIATGYGLDDQGEREFKSR